MIDDKITSVGGYKASDGAFFESYAAALAHQRLIEFCDWYEGPNRDPLFGGDGAVSSSDLTGWLTTHRQQVLALRDA